MFDSIDLIEYLFGKLRFLCFILIVQLMQSVLYLIEFIHNELSSTPATAHLLAIGKFAVVEIVLLVVPTHGHRSVSLLMLHFFGASTFVAYVVAEVLTYFIVVIGF